MTPAVRNTIDALIGAALFFAAQALVTEAHAAIEEIDMQNMQSVVADVPIATTLPRSEEATADLLALVGVEVTPDEVAEWSDWKIQKAEDWAGALLLHKSAGTTTLSKPAFLNAYLSSGGVRP